MAVKSDLFLYLQLKQFPYLTLNKNLIKITSTELVHPPKIQWRYTENLGHVTSFVETHMYKFTQTTGKQASELIPKYAQLSGARYVISHQCWHHASVEVVCVG